MVKPEAEEGVEGVLANYKDAYCGKVQSLYGSIKGVCRDADAQLISLSGRASQLINLVSDATSLVGLAGLSVGIATWNDPSSALDPHNILAIISAMRSAAYLVGRIKEGWQDASTACIQLAEGAIGIKEPDEEMVSLTEAGRDVCPDIGSS